LVSFSRTLTITGFCIWQDAKIIVITNRIQRIIGGLVVVIPSARGFDFQKFRWFIIKSLE